jgi:hypothetical protein
MEHTAPLFRRERIELYPDVLGLPEIPLMGRLNYSRAHRPLKVHKHAGSMEICYLLKGRQSYFVGPREYSLSGGDLFVTFPGEAHSTGRAPEEKSILYWVIVDLGRANAPFLGLLPGEARELRKALLSLHARHFKGGVVLRDLLDAIILAAHDPSKPLRGLYIRNKLAQFLMQVAEYAKKKSAPESLNPLKGVLTHIQEHLGEKLSVTALAREAGLSASRFKAKFKRIMGMPPGEYVLRKKIDRAGADRKSVV